MSKDLEGYGSFIVPRTPMIAGTPLSRANWTCASWESLGANDMAITFLLNKYAPQLATYMNVNLTH
ncbi:hypothetical protein HanPI659440_Chr09g0353041 [Helianthus annuus]|nr:hypothetical protein HanPI659440_Chr09g0353041 [Helianthus annuus]